MADSPQRRSEVVVGVMMMDVEGRDSEGFRRLVDRAVAAWEESLCADLRLRVNVFAFEGPHLTPTAGAYSPLDFLEIGMAEKLERSADFLLVVTEVDLIASVLSYTLALPSQLTNVGIVSTKRLRPEFWGDSEDENLAAQRLTALLLHTFGHLLNLSHADDPRNAMFDFKGVEELDRMGELTAAQRERMRQMLPSETREEVARRRSLFGFVVRTLGANAGRILQAVVRANPLRLMTRLPTMIAAALSAIVVLFFSAEVWDVAGTVEFYQLVLFATISVGTATFVLYRTFAFGTLLDRDRLLSESTVVTEAATVLSLLATMLLLFGLFAGLMYAGIVTIFPTRLMETWPTVDPAVRTLDHVQLSLFLAAMGVLAGSLGGRADSRDLIRSVLFVDEES